MRHRGAVPEKQFFTKWARSPQPKPSFPLELQTEVGGPAMKALGDEAVPRPKRLSAEARHSYQEERKRMGNTPAGQAMVAAI